MRYVRVDDGRVVEVGDFDGIEGRFHPSLTWVQSDTAELGDLYDGETFSPPAPPEQSPEELQAEIVAATQARLDAFARTRSYDGILSACTYATSAVPRFRADGQHCVEMRDATWARLYELLAEVQAGSRPMPESFADIEPELPALQWPSGQA